MDYAQIVALIAALSGAPAQDSFAPLRDAAQRQDANIKIQTCPRPLPTHEIEGVTLICGVVFVPEDRSKIGGKKLGLNFSILRAASKFPEPDPVVYLEGGPGGSAMTMLPLLAQLFDPWRLRRDIIIYDQRSAGTSGASVNCNQALSSNVIEFVKSKGEIPSADKMKLCVDELNELGVPLSAYNTTENAFDLPLIISSLGYRDYNIYGISYGTKLALETMRVAPKNIRSVIIDGVAPSWVNLYNSFAMKTDEAIQHLVDQCAGDQICNEAYPELGRIISETLDKASKGEIEFRGEKIPPAFVLAPIITRNGKYGSVAITRFIPAYIYELWRGKEMPTVEALIAVDFDIKTPSDADILATATKLDAQQKLLIRQILDNKSIESRTSQSTARAVEGLRETFETKKKFGAIAQLFDAELSSAITENLQGDRQKLGPILADYTSMQNATPSKERLLAFIAAHFAGDAQDRLSALIDSMNAKEVEGSFAIIKRDTLAAFNPFLFGLYLDIYACQEDIPFNTYEGYLARTKVLKYPHLGDLSDGLVRSFFDSCKALMPNPRENWHVPVQSNIPTLSFGGLFDVQTPASWAKTGIEKLTNAQAFMIPEAGHGAVLYQRCVADMGVAFIDNPARRFDESCARSIQINWHIAPWVARNSQPQLQ